MNRRWLASVVCALLVAAACGGDDDEAAEEETTTTNAAATTIADVAPLDPASIPVSTREVTRIELPGDPDWMAADDERIWVRLARSVVGIDPAAASVASTFEIIGDLCNGIGAGFGAVWTCAGGDIVRLDPATGEVIATIAVGKTTENGQFVTTSDRLWVLRGEGSDLVGIDPATNEVADTIDVGVRGTDLAPGQSGVWVTSVSGDAVVHVDLEAGEVTQTIQVDEPRAIAETADGVVWIATPSALHQADAGSGEITASIGGGVGRDGWLAPAPDGVWVRSVRTVLHRVEGVGADATVVERVQVDGLTSGGDVIYAHGALWTAAYDDATVLRVAG